MEKVGRNEKCPCGSGKKYKYCHGGSSDSAPKSSSLVDADSILFAAADNMLMNRVEREARTISQGFDLLCRDQIVELEEIYGSIGVLLVAGKKYTESSRDLLRSVLFKVLTNALKSFTAAFSLLRTGWRLQPYQCLRNCMEALSVTLHLFMHGEDLEKFEKDKLQSTATFKSAKELMPVFGKVYGILSEEFTHVGRPFRFVQNGGVYTREEDDLWQCLGALAAVLWLFYQTTELIFLGLTGTPRFWEEIEVGRYELKLSEEAMRLQQKLVIRFHGMLKTYDLKPTA